jgi:hypothetical protein
MVTCQALILKKDIEPRGFLIYIKICYEIRSLGNKVVNVCFYSCIGYFNLPPFLLPRF